MAKNTLEIIIKANATQAQNALKELQSTIGKPFAGLKAVGIRAGYSVHSP